MNPPRVGADHQSAIRNSQPASQAFDRQPAGRLTRLRIKDLDLILAADNHCIGRHDNRSIRHTLHLPLDTDLVLGVELGSDGIGFRQVLGFLDPPRAVLAVHGPKVVAQLRPIGVDGRIGLLVQACQGFASRHEGRIGGSGHLAAQGERPQLVAQDHGVGTGDLAGGQVECLSGRATPPTGHHLDLAGLAIHRRRLGSARREIECRGSGQQVPLR